MVFVSRQFYLALFTVNSGSFFVFRLSCLFLNFSENLGIFRVALLFICQRSKPLALQELCCVAVVLSGNSDILSQPLSFVNNFFKNFFVLENFRFP